MPLYDTAMVPAVDIPVTRDVSRIGRAGQRKRRYETMAVITSPPQIARWMDVNDIPEETTMQYEHIRCCDVEDYLPLDMRGIGAPVILPQKIVEQTIGTAILTEFNTLPYNRSTQQAMEQRSATMINDLIARGRLNYKVPRFGVRVNYNQDAHQADVRIAPELFNAPWMKEQNKEPMEWNGHIWIVDKKQKLKDQIHKQLSPALVNHHGKSIRANRVNFGNAGGNEIVALTLLKQMVSEDVFKKYLKYGFVTVRGESGLYYQVQRKSHIINVWHNGKMISTLCVYLQDQSIPPTDEVVAKMLICECDEVDIWRRANIGGIWNANKTPIQKQIIKLKSSTIQTKDLKNLAAA